MIAEEYRVDERSINGIKEKLNALTQGIPDDVAILAGKAVAQAIGQRVKFQSQDARGQRLDPTSPVTTEIKARHGRPDRPLVATGELTDPGAWNVTYDGNTITLNLDGSLHEKWDSIILNAQNSGRNWNYAFDLNEAELSAALFAIISWINKQLGIETFDADNLTIPEMG